MRKLILATCAVIVLAAGCARERSVFDDIKPGTEVTLAMRNGSVVSGRLTDVRRDTLVVQPADGPAATVRRSDIVTLGMATAATSGTGQTPLASAGQASAGSTSSVPSTAAPIAAASPAPAASAAANWREITIPAGTRLPLRLDQSVASDYSHAEQQVRATLTQGVVVKGVTVVPAGSVIGGSVTRAKRAGRIKGRAELGVRFDSLLVKGGQEAYRIRTSLVALRASSTHRKDALEIGIPAVGGAIVGGLLGGGKGAVAGGAVGGGAGTAVVLGTRGKEVRLPRGMRLAVRLLAPVTIRIPA